MTSPLARIESHP